jgi:hypothetical protein
MSFRSGVVLSLALPALLFLVGCGGSSTPKATPPPSGGYSNSNLNGTYTFSSLGTDSGNAFFAMAGSLTANGSGGITGGNVDVNDALAGQLPNLAITSGTYNISADGRGTAKVNTSSGAIGFDFVLTSNAHGLITRFDAGGSGSGSLDQQTAVTLAGPYTFSVSGVDGGLVNPMGAVGAFTVSGANIAGTADINDAKFGFANQTLSGTIALGSGTAPGTATLTAGSFTFTFDVYAIDSTHLKFIESDAAQIVVGDAFAQQTAIPSGQLVFTAVGFDSVNAPMAMGGSMHSDGVGMITNGLQDVNDAGNVSPSQLSFGGSFTPVSGGRSVFTLNTFFNGASGTFNFAAYPSGGGIQLLEIDSSGITMGAAFAQGSTTFAAPQGYGFNVSASNLTLGLEEDDIAEFTASGGNLTGIFDANDQGGLTGDKGLSGATYASDGSSDGRGQILTSNFVNGLYYVIDGSNVLFLETDTNQVGTGALGVQTSSSAPVALAIGHFAHVHPKGAAKAGTRLK